MESSNYHRRVLIRVARYLVTIYPVSNICAYHPSEIEVQFLINDGYDVGMNFCSSLELCPTPIRIEADKYVCSGEQNYPGDSLPFIYLPILMPRKTERQKRSESLLS